MRPWQQHCDQSLEHQYQLGLEALNEHLPEIKVELIFQVKSLKIVYISFVLMPPLMYTDSYIKWITVLGTYWGCAIMEKPVSR